MKSRIYMTLCSIVLFAFIANDAVAQRENSDIRNGNKEFSSGNYTNAEVLYRSALQQNGASEAAMSNLGSALFREEQYSDAAAAWAKVTENAELSAKDVAGAYYNKGNAELAERKLDEAIESYKNSLRRNPNDQNAKYNLAYAQALKQDGDGGGGGDDDQDQDQDQDQKEDQQDQDQQDQKEDPQEQDDKDDKEDKGEQEQQQGEKPESRADAERMADAIQRAEDRTKEKVEKERAKAVEVGGGKSW